MVDRLTPRPLPAQVPDPGHFTSFADWLKEMFRRGVKQNQLALGSGVTPQAVTKWLKGGSVAPKVLADLAGWTGARHRALRDLVQHLSDERPPDPEKRKQFDEIVEMLPLLSEHELGEVLKTVRFYRSKKRTEDPAGGDTQHHSRTGKVTEFKPRTGRHGNKQNR